MPFQDEFDKLRTNRFVNSKSLLIISGPSAVGKSYFAHHLYNYYGFKWIPGVTTRPARQGEEFSPEKLFCGEQFYLHLRNQGKLALEKQMFGYWYAFLIEDLQAANTSLNESTKRFCLLRYDAVESMRRIIPSARLLYIKPSDIGELEKRLLQRFLKSDEVEQRLSEMHRELESITKTESAHLSTDIVIDNDYTDASLNKFLNAVDQLMNS